MDKRFISISNDDISVSDPNEIETWRAPNYKKPKKPTRWRCPERHLKKCEESKQKLKSEDEILKLYKGLLQNDKKSISKDENLVKPRCLKTDKFTECVRPQRTISQQKMQAALREKALITKEKLDEVRHDAQEPSKYLHEGKSLIKISSTSLFYMREPRPPCSQDIMYIPTRNQLEYTTPYGVFLNEEELPNDISLPFDKYNPRLLQAKADLVVPHTLIERDGKYFIKLPESDEGEEEESGDNLDQRRNTCTEPCRCLFFKKTFDDARDFEDCLHNFPKIFEIPEDLNRWFSATAILGSTRCQRERDDVKKEEDSRRRRSLAALYTAFFHTYTELVTEWEYDEIDKIIDEAEELQEKSTEWHFQDANGDFDIIPEDLEKGMTLKLERMYTGALNCFDPNIFKALYKFFQKGQTCIVQCKTLYLLIWRMCDHFWIFDPNARTEKCERNWYDGKAALMKAKPLEHVVHIILNLSELAPEDVYNLYEVRLVNFGTIPSPIETRAAQRKKKLFLVINKYYAVIPGTTGMGPPEDADDANSSLLVALFGLIYGRMDLPRHWPRKVIDSIIKFGERYTRKYLKDNKLDSLNIRNLPTELYIGSYRIDVEFVPFHFTGHLNECTNYRFSPLTSCILEVFRNYKAALIQIDASAVAIWRDAKFYYVFDPFQRGTAGQFIDVEEDSGNAILQMHIILESICRILYMNAIDMMSNGIFLIHPVIIKSISYMSRLQSQVGKGQEFLKIAFPIQCDIELGITEVISCSDIKEASKELPPNVPDDCLSILSQMPCQRTCSESDVYEQEKKEKAKQKKEERLKHADSLESLLESVKIPEDDSGDIALPVLEHIICLIIGELAARARDIEMPTIKAKRVLLKSDKGHLESLKVRVNRGEDYDNFSARYPTEPPVREEWIVSLKDKLKYNGWFNVLPDGVRIVLGRSEIAFNEKENLLSGLFAAVAASVIAGKYGIDGWASKALDYVMKTGKILQEAYQPPKDIVSFLVGKQISKVQLGSKIYRVNIRKIDSGKAEDISDILEKCLTRLKSVILLFNSFSCAIFRRSYFFYLLIGFPCDFMGFRTSQSGKPCLLRFHEYSSFLQRIDFNRLIASPKQQFIVLNVHVRDISPDKPGRYRQLDELWKYERGDAVKVALIDDDLRKEKERIRSFQEEKQRHEKKHDEMDEEEDEPGRKLLDTEPIYVDKEQKELGNSFSETEPRKNEDSEEEEVKKKHIPGRKIPNTEPNYADKERKELELGYRLRETDLLFKIQGTKSMESRSGGSPKLIRPCYFAGVYAILFAVLRPLNKWEFRRIDQVIENANELFEAISDKSTACDRKIDKLRADQYLFNLTVRVYEGIKVKGTDISDALNKIAKQKQYFILQFSNCTFAVYKDQYWNLFDAYKTLEEVGGIENEEEEEDKGEEKNDEKENVIHPKGIKMYPDRNSASWVLFPSMDTMLEYVSKRAESEKWRTQFRLHTVDIRSFKKAPKQARLILSETHDKEKEIVEDIDCLSEKVKWLQRDIPTWSRTLDENAIGDKRGIRLSLWKFFDVEVPNTLFSLWGSLHPLAPVFKKSRGKQYLATNVIACCMANLYRITEWNSNVIDTIVINGDKYFNESSEDIKQIEYEFTLEDLNTQYQMNRIRWDIHLESVINGTLYNKFEWNLSRALTYFFTNFRMGIIQCFNRSLAFGRANKGYFLFDCQSYGPPLFKKSEGSAYILLSMTLTKLIYCIVMSLRIPYYNMYFVIHNVEVSHISEFHYDYIAADDPEQEAEIQPEESEE